MINIPLRFHVKILIRALEFQNGGVRTSVDLHHKSIKKFGNAYHYQLFQNSGS